MSFSGEQLLVLERFKRGENLFVTGPGGTGKTHLIREMVRIMKETGSVYQVCAMTGCAAVLLGCGAKTLHSWCGMGLATGHKDAIAAKIAHNKKTAGALKKVKVMIVDEVSMLSKVLFEAVDMALKAVRKNPLPFGGVQVIFTGDFFQLPPVGKDEESSRFCFESAEWCSVFPWKNHIELTHIFRQDDPVYRRVLNQVRRGELDAEGLTILRGCLQRELVGEVVPTKLFAIRSKADFVNTRMYEKLEGEEHVFSLAFKFDLATYVESGKPIGLLDLNKGRCLTSEQKKMEAESLANHMNRVQELKLKKGARVMCLHNVNVEEGICNGSQGVVVDFVKDMPLVLFSNGLKRVMDPIWHQSEEYPSIGVGQIPLCLAWALTIHKIQGATLSLAEMDLGNSVFEFGQTYVALSRIRSLDGLYLSAFQPARIKANPLVKEFYDEIPKEPLSMPVSMPDINVFQEFACPTDVKVVRL